VRCRRDRFGVFGDASHAHDIADALKKFRTMQLETMTTVLESYGLEPATIPRPPLRHPRDVGGISQYLLIEQAFDLDIGHAETVALIEEHITTLGGPRRSTPEEFAAHRVPPPAAV
jgi:hypothetical protein